MRLQILEGLEVLTEEVNHVVDDFDLLLNLQVFKLRRSSGR